MAPVHHVKFPVYQNTEKLCTVGRLRMFMSPITGTRNTHHEVDMSISELQIHWVALTLARIKRATTRDCQFSIFQIELLMIEFEKCGSIITVHRITLLCVCTIFHGGQRLFANCCKTLPLKAPTHCTITAILSVHCMSLCARWVNIRGVLCDPCTVINSHPARARLRLKCSWGIF